MPGPAVHILTSIAKMSGEAIAARQLPQTNTGLASESRYKNSYIYNFLFYVMNGNNYSKLYLQEHQLICSAAGEPKKGILGNAVPEPSG